MKNLICMAALAVAFSTPAFATSDREACHYVATGAQQDLRLAKEGYNTYEALANNPERMAEYGFNNSVMFLVISQTMWENRKTYTAAQAYKIGYRLCMELK